MQLKSITIRVTLDELQQYTELARQLGISRTALIKKSIAEYKGTVVPEEESNDTIVDKARSVYTSPRSISDVNHPLLDKIEREGLKILDDRGNTVAKLRNIENLLDFVQSKVLQHG